MKSIFISYNQGSQVGKNTALRMQTISNLYGTTVFLPARSNGFPQTINEETARRIELSSMVVVFSLERSTSILLAELNYAIKLNKPIVALYDEMQGENIDFGEYKDYYSGFINYQNTEATLHKVAEFLDTIPSNGKKSQNGVNTAIVGIGLGLLALWMLGKD